MGHVDIEMQSLLIVFGLTAGVGCVVSRTVSIYYKLSLFNAHAMILIFHVFVKANKLCFSQL